jgi:hypothetical protein
MNTKYLDEILAANSAQDLFGDITNKTKAGIIYRRFARNSHPDMYFNSADKIKAEEAFIRLTELWDSVGIKTPKQTKNVIKTRKHEYVLGLKFCTGDIFDRYAATFDAGNKQAELLVTRNPADEDLAENNVYKVKELKEKVPDGFKMYFPSYIETFRWKQGNRNFIVTALDHMDGFYTLAQVKERYPNGVHPKDFAWMFRRMLVAAGNTRDAGLVNGAITPESLIIHPEKHGLVLQDWGYAVHEGEPLTAIPAEYKSMYPQYALDKKPVDYRLDILMLAKTAETLLSPDAPRQFKAFLNGTKVATPPTAGELLEDFDELITRLWGPKAFHPFTMDV